MSGGYWGYSRDEIQSALISIANDPTVEERWPYISLLFTDLADILYDAEHDMDLDLCDDALIADDAAFERNVIAKILAAVVKVSPEE